MLNNSPTKFESNFATIILVFIPPFIFIGVGILISFFYDPTYSGWLCFLFSLPVFIHSLGWFLIHREKDNLSVQEPTKVTEREIDITIKQQVKEPNHQESKDLHQHVSERTTEDQDGISLNDLIVGAETFCLFYNRSMLASVIFYCLAWIGYLSNSNLPLEILNYFSLLCLIFILVLFGVAVYVTYTIMENSPRHKSEVPYMSALGNGLKLFPFWRFAHFFAIFMSISFLFGFAFAFHDLSFRKSYRNAKEYNASQPIVQQEVPKVESALYVENLASDEAGTNPDPPKSKPTVDSPGCFYFESGKANFIHNDRDEELKARPSLDKWIALNREDKNFNQFGRLLSQINQNKSLGILRIILLGRADDKKSGNIYPSNYALSEARINETKYVITTNLYNNNDKAWQNIDWVTVPYSNENPKLIKGKCDDLESDIDSGRRVVEVYLNIVSPDAEALETTKLRKKQFEELNRKKYKTPNLMDYMYFSIYTISTTGYGDIKPVTNYAKFLVSLENFFEVFFLVCFMNTLIALKSKTISLTKIS